MNELPTHCINLKAFRTSLNMRQKDIANKLGVSVTLYNQVETGKINPTYNFLEKLAKAFPDININKLLFDLNIFKLCM
ncbi:helix-turn-helix domain-containing protein [Peptacetobacter sp.]|uniref:helix-turn-helix domain-containing protein n=1 Tax=Peptacetobacter sp. TaxID=2991975 RepID=UPI002E7A9573|nr:helix-turn-helix transcriptional regulator [Peptacetobacter sp.]MEE0451945.1 helix-turn-helix transcriptional regulator [Peptacetobacter sp.]